MSLQRFHEAQASSTSGYTTALGELRAGAKTSHWIWYVLPQLESLGRSPTAKFYGLRDLEEAAEYWHDADLRSRLVTIVEAVAANVGRQVSLEQLMGGAGDRQKLVSCVTLFEAVAVRYDKPDLADARRRFLQATAVVVRAARNEGLARCAHTLGVVNGAA